MMFKELDYIKKGFDPYFYMRRCVYYTLFINLFKCEVLKIWRVKTPPPSTNK